MPITRDSFDRIRSIVAQNPDIPTRQLARETSVSRDAADKYRNLTEYPAKLSAKLPKKAPKSSIKQTLRSLFGLNSSPRFVTIVPEIHEIQPVLSGIQPTRSRKIGISHAIIPDCQVRPGVDTEHLRHIGNYLAEKRADVIVCVGDFADMPSLSSYTVGKAEAEGQRYVEDVKSVKDAMEKLLAPIRAVKDYHPRMLFTMGNHEYRIDREAEANPKLIGKISTDDLGYAETGWEVHPFLEVVTVHGVQYSHYFTSGVLGRPVSSAAALLRERQCSAVMGHVQYTDLAFHKKTGNFGLFCGIAYTHDEKYLGFQGNTTRRQIVMLNEVKDGTADPYFVSLEFLRKNYDY